jgi:hypothetical protein
MTDDDAPKPNSVNLLKETNLTLQCAKFPCIKVGDSSLIQLYGEDITTPNLDSDLTEELVIVDKKFAEPWHSLGSTLMKPPPSSFKEENLEEKLVEKPFLRNITPWEGVLDRSVKLLPDTTTRQANLLEKSGFPTVRFFTCLCFFPRRII